jgi:hypothetical protein
MRVAVMTQMAEGVGSQEQPQVVADLEQNLERAKRYVTDI